MEPGSSTALVQYAHDALRRDAAAALARCEDRKAAVAAFHDARLERSTRLKEALAAARGELEALTASQSSEPSEAHAVHARVEVFVERRRAAEAARDAAHADLADMVTTLRAAHETRGRASDDQGRRAHPMSHFFYMPAARLGSAYDVQL